jgi:hypothetical protein
MFRLTRIGLGAALAVVLAATSGRAAEADKLIPADAEFVAAVNVKQILGSDIIKKYALEQMKQTLQGNDAQKFLKELGLDPLKDIDRVVVAGSGKDQADAKYLAIVHGKFDPEKLYKAAEAQTRKDADKFSLIKDGKDVMFKYQPDNGNPVYGTVVDETTVVAGSDKKIITEALAAASAGKKPAISRDLSGLITRMDDKDSLWMVGVVKGKLDNVRLPGGGGGNPALAAQLAKMDTLSIIVRVTTDVNAEINLGMKDADSAGEMGQTVSELVDTAKGALPFLAAQNPQLKPLVEASKSLKSTVKDRSVVITAKLTGAAIGQMLGGSSD